MPGRPRERILANLETVYREAYDRAKSAGDERRMLDLDAAFQREQLLLEVLLDIRDAISATTRPDTSGVDPIAALDTIRRVAKLR